MRAKSAVACLAVLSFFTTTSIAQSLLGSCFTYQGEIQKNGIPAEGTVHLRFRLWDAPGSGQPPVGGNLIGASQIASEIPVENGVSNVALKTSEEYGPDPYNGEALDTDRGLRRSELWFSFGPKSSPTDHFGPVLP